MMLAVSIMVSIVMVFLLMMVDLVIGGILAIGIIIGLLIRILFLLDGLHKVLITKEKRPNPKKTALERYLEERDSKEAAAQPKG